mgnify:CR=1 FL=1
MEKHRALYVDHRQLGILSLPSQVTMEMAHPPSLYPRARRGRKSISMSRLYIKLLYYTVILMHQ